MVTWREALPSSESAGVLLDRYFTARARAFPSGSDSYHRTSVSDEQFVPPNGVFLIVEGENLSGEPADVGCGGVRRIDDGPAGARFEVKHLWIQPHARRLGYGRALMTELAQHAQSLGGRELVLDTHESLEQASALYRSLGFEPIEPYNENPNATTWLGRALA